MQLIPIRIIHYYPCQGTLFMPTGSYRPAHTLCALAAALICAGVALPVVAADAAPAARQQSGTYTFAVAQQPLVAALNDFSQVTGWQVGLPAELAQGVASPGVKGALTPEKALERLLLGTGLSYRKLGDNSVVLERSVGAALALQQITVSATRQADEVSKVPATVTVHTREALDQQNVNDIRDLVRYEPGVSVGGAGNRAGTTGYNIRGIDGNRILTQVDGVEVPDSFFNGPYAQTERNYVDPEIIKRVEILRGPASVLYGSSAIGGAVSYFTLDPEDIIKPGQDYGARLKTGYSSKDDSWLKSATLAGRSGDFDGLVHFSQRDGHETESYGEHGGTGLNRTEANPEDARKTNVLAKVGWNYAEDSRLAFTYEKYKSDVDTNQLSAVGGPFTPTGAGVGLYRTRQGNDTISRERFGVAHDFGLDSAVADHVKWSFNYQLAKTDQRTEEIYFPFAYTLLRTRDTVYQERQWVLDAQADKAFSIGDSDHLLTYGSNLKRQKVTGSRSGTATCLTATGACRAVGAGGSLAASALAKVSDFPDPTVDTYALFAQDQISWNRWTFTPGLSYTYTSLKPHATDAFLASVASDPDGTFDDSTKIWHKFTPSFGVTYAFDDHYTWYGQYSEGFRTPSAKSLYGRFENTATGYIVKPNPGLKPEESRSYETGLRGNFDAGSFDLSVFYNQYKNFIDEDNVTNGATELTFQANNVKHAVIKGTELKGRLNLDSFGAPQGMYARGSMAYLWGENQDTGTPLNTINPFTSVIGLGYSQPQYGSEMSWTLVKRKTRIDDSTFYAPDGATKFHPPGYGVVDLTGYYKLTSDLTVSGGVYNLANKKYWQWDDVRGYDGVGEAGAVSPANIDRLSQPGRNFAINLVWDL
jgi:hemoglobin/transferrin/lactoferrin receptor protein